MGGIDVINPAAPWKRKSGTALASSVLVFEAIGNGNFRRVTYLFTAFNDAENVHRSFDYTVLNNNGVYKDTVSGKIKIGSVDYAIDAVNNAGIMEIRITNNELYDLTISAVRVIVV